jgi:hypothetical protein
MKHQEKIRPLVRGCYDIQKLRIQFGNRVCSTFKVKLGIKPSQKENADKDKKKILDAIRKDYKLLSQGASGVISLKRFKGCGIISDYTEYCLAHAFMGIEREEKEHFKLIGSGLKDIPIWKGWLKDVCGVGPAMGGVIISEIDIGKAQYPSSLHKYAGLDVTENGQGRSRKKEHLAMVGYIDKNGEKQTRDGITFNPFLKTKLVGVLASSFIKQNPENCVYRKIYDDYKNRLENHPKHIGKTKGHRNNMAKRYMIKRFLIDLYTNWRKIEGLPVSEEYAVAKLGIVHRKAA